MLIAESQRHCTRVLHRICGSYLNPMIWHLIGPACKQWLIDNGTCNRHDMHTVAAPSVTPYNRETTYTLWWLAIIIIHHQLSTVCCAKVCYKPYQPAQSFAIFIHRVSQNEVMLPDHLVFGLAGHITWKHWMIFRTRQTCSKLLQSLIFLFLYSTGANHTMSWLYSIMGDRKETKSSQCGY